MEMKMMMEIINFNCVLLVFMAIDSVLVTSKIVNFLGLYAISLDVVYIEEEVSK